jgi:NADH:ubiquinone oxidoreductase subunit 4 (subunit M)
VLTLPVSYIVTFFPLLGAFFVLNVDKERPENAMAVTLWATSSAFLFAMLQLFVPNLSKIITHDVVSHFVNKLPGWYSANLDNFSVLFVTFVCFVSLLSVIWIRHHKITYQKSFFISLLLFEVFTIAAFYSTDMFLLFFCMESTMIPLYTMMLSHDKEADSQGSKNRSYVLRYLLYGMASALLILTAIIMIYLETKTSDLFEIYKIGVKNEAVFWILLLGIGIKMPIWPFCNWLPTVHTKANVICSVILASIVLKFSTLIILRFISPLFHDHITHYNTFLFMACFVSILIAIANIFRQDDLKRFFSYFSIIHMNLYFLIFINNGGGNNFIYAMLQHSLISVIMFFTIDIIGDLYGTRSMHEIRESCKQIRGLRMFLLCIFLALIGIPLTSGFIAEIMVIYSVSNTSYIQATMILLLMVAISTYTFYVYHVTFGKRKKNRQQNEVIEPFATRHDRKAAITVCYLLILLLGICPKLVTSVLN